MADKRRTRMSIVVLLPAGAMKFIIAILIIITAVRGCSFDPATLPTPHMTRFITVFCPLTG
jgi:hypothetical protein